jgi:DNA-binding CsgD family transcriptional regulator
MTNDLPQISEREREILRLVAMGATNQQIAHELHISINTVKVHLRNIFEKIGVTSRTEATVYAIRQGLVELGGAAEPAALAAEPPAIAAEPALAPATTHTAIAEIASPEPVLVPESAQPPIAALPEQAPTAARRTSLLPVFVGLSVLLGAALIYLLVQRGSAPTADPTQTPNTGAVPANRWKQHAAWPNPRDNAAFAAYDNKIYAIGGSGAAGASGANDRFDPAQNQWVPLNEKPTPATNIQAVTIGGRIYVPGGEGKDGKVLTAFEAYDPRSKQWESLPPLPAPRSRYALSSFEGKLYLFGGWDGSSARKEVFEYDPTTNAWAERAPLPTARSNAGAALVQDHIYVIGGENEQGPLGVNERFDPIASEAGAWESVVPLATASAKPAVVGTVNSVVIFDPQAHTATQYNPATDSWSSALEIPANTPISSRALLLSTSIFLFGPPAGSPGGAVSEYQASYQTLFPVVGNG